MSVNGEGTDQPGHLCNLIVSFTVILLNQCAEYISKALIRLIWVLTAHR